LNAWFLVGTQNLLRGAIKGNQPFGTHNQNTQEKKKEQLYEYSVLIKYNNNAK